MAYRTSNQAWSEGLEAGIYCQQYKSELQTAIVTHLQKKKFQLSGWLAVPIFPDNLGLYFIDNYTTVCHSFLVLLKQLLRLNYFE
jgi:hypothetical protein